MQLQYILNMENDDFTSIDQLFEYIAEYGKSQGHSKQSRRKILENFTCNGCNQRFDNDENRQEKVWLAFKLPDYQLCNSCHKNGTYPICLNDQDCPMNLEEDFIPIEDNFTFYQESRTVALLDTPILKYKLPSQLDPWKIVELSKRWFLGLSCWNKKTWMYNSIVALNGMKARDSSNGILHHPDFGSIRGWIPCDHYSHSKSQNKLSDLFNLDDTDTKKTIILTKDEQVDKIKDIWVLVNCDLSNPDLFGRIATAVMDANYHLGINTSNNKTIQDYLDFKHQLFTPILHALSFLSLQSDLIEIVSSYFHNTKDACIQWHLMLNQSFLF